MRVSLAAPWQLRVRRTLWASSAQQRPSNWKCGARQCRPRAAQLWLSLKANDAFGQLHYLFRALTLRGGRRCKLRRRVLPHGAERKPWAKAPQKVKLERLLVRPRAETAVIPATRCVRCSVVPCVAVRREAPSGLIPRPRAVPHSARLQHVYRTHCCGWLVSLEFNAKYAIPLPQRAAIARGSVPFHSTPRTNACDGCRRAHTQRVLYDRSTPARRAPRGARRAARGLFPNASHVR